MDVSPRGSGGDGRSVLNLYWRDKEVTVNQFQDMKSVSLRAVARNAGVSIATASRALSDSPLVRASLRRRIQVAATELGYRKDAAVSAIMREFRRKGGETHRGTLAYLICDLETTWNDPAARHYRYLLDSARQRASAQGYDVEIFPVEQPTMTGTRLGGILRARGITGVLLAPPVRVQKTIDFPWTEFVSVEIGNFHLTPTLHRASRDYYLDTAMGWDQLRARGYRRIGYATSAEFAARANNIGLASFALAQLQLPARDRVPMLCKAGLTSAEMLRWMRRYQPEALICEHANPIRWIREAGWDVPGQIECICLSIQPYETDLSGLVVPYAAIGKSAVDLLTKLVEQDETGVPRQPRAVLTRGIWQEGRTLRSPSPAALR